MRISKPISYFLIVGIFTVFIDYSVYTFLNNLISNNSLAKIVGFLSGTIFSFLANRSITFKNQNNILGQLIIFFFLYSTTLIINVVINKNLLNWLFDYNYKVHISFIVATSVTAIINFTGMKYLVFINKNQKKETFEKN